MVEAFSLRSWIFVMMVETSDPAVNRKGASVASIHHTKLSYTARNLSETAVGFSLDFGF
tara:strand:+ start:3506 stop:3682 length:177 start_codon:yes stop_codon:yes gene_type:complete